MLSGLQNWLLSFDLTQILLLVPIYLITLSVHEYAHARAAYALGDPTARNLGRMTLNPVKHIDPIGFMVFVIWRFGWAKPVPVNTRHFKNGGRDMGLTALAGPMSNIAMGIIAVLIYKISLKIFYSTSPEIMWNFYSLSMGEGIAYNMFSAKMPAYFMMFVSIFVSANFYIAVFNLVPIPPLDGSRIINMFLSPKASFHYHKIERYGFIILMLLLYTGMLTIPLSFISGSLVGAVDWLFDLIPFLRIG